MTELTGAETHERDVDMLDEKIFAESMSGRVSDRQGRNGDKYRGVIERRVTACMRVAGCTLAALKTHDPERYRRFLRGCTRAIRREAATSDGTLSGGDLAELRRRFRMQGETDRIVDEFPDFEDRAEAMYP